MWNGWLCGLTCRRLRRIRPQCRLLDIQLSPCTASSLRRAVSKAFHTRSTLSSEGSDRPGRFAMHRHASHWNFFIPLLDALPHRGVLSELVPKTSLLCHNRLCSCALKHAKSLLPSRRRHLHSTCSPGGHRWN